MMSINVTELLVKTLESACKDLVNRAVTECADKYHFDANEAIHLLGTDKIAIHAKKMIRGPVAKKITKDAIPMPFLPDHVNHDLCQGLRFNHGLFTQCTSNKMNASHFCKACQIDADKNSSAEPTSGTVAKRISMADDFVDAKGRKPKNYALLLKKMKIDFEEAIRYAQGKNLDIAHLLTVESTTKQKKTKNAKNNADTNDETNTETNTETNIETKKRGRPRKQPIEVESVTDMFALYAQANPQNETPSEPEPEPIQDDNITQDTEQDPVLKLQLSDEDKHNKKALLDAKKEQDKLAKQQQKELEKQQKLVQKEQEKLTKLAQKEAEKKLKEQQKEQAKLQKEQEKLQKQKATKNNTNNTNTETNTNTNTHTETNTNTNTNTEQIVTQTIVNAQPLPKIKYVKIDGKPYTIHLDTNQVYELEQHVGTYDPEEKSIEFFDEQDDEQEQEDQELHEEELI